MTPDKVEPQQLSVATVAQWERWLAKHHATTPEGVWLRFPKTSAMKVRFDPREIVDVALCFGWIDGQARKSDDADTRVVRYTPRRPRSVWSKINVARAERLVAEGRMRPAGLAEIERAKADGRWERAYDPPSSADLPADFLAAVAQNEKAAAFLATLTKRNIFPIVHRLQTASTAETRARRLAAMVAMLERGETFYD